MSSLLRCLLRRRRHLIQFRWHERINTSRRSRHRRPLWLTRLSWSTRLLGLVRIPTICDYCLLKKLLTIFRKIKNGKSNLRILICAITNASILTLWDNDTSSWLLNDKRLLWSLSSWLWLLNYILRLGCLWDSLNHCSRSGSNLLSLGLGSSSRV